MKHINRDTLILVFKIYVGNIDQIDIPIYINDAYDALKPNEEDNVVAYFVPVFEEPESPIECINPKLITDDEFEHITEKLKDLNEKYDEFLKEIRK